MKKTKYLSSILSFLLILGVSACSISSNDDTANDDSEEAESTQDLNLYDLLEDIEKNNNYSVGIEYYEIYSECYTSDDDFNANYADNLYYVDYYVDIYYTKDAVLIGYYYVYGNYLFIFDTELYVNDYDNNQLILYFVSESDDDIDYTDLEVAATYDGTWQDFLFSLINLAPYSYYFEEGESYYSEAYGNMIDYYIDFDADFMFMLLNCLFCGGNWLPNYAVSGPNNMYALAYQNMEYYYLSTYYPDTNEWGTALDTGAIKWYNYSSGQYYTWYEEDSLSAYVYDVGSTSIPSYFEDYLIK